MIPSDQPSVAKRATLGSRIELGLVVALSVVASAAYLYKYWPWFPGALATPLEVLAVMPVLVFAAAGALTLGSERVVDFWRARLAERPWLAWLYPGALVGLYAVGTGIGGHAAISNIAILAIYLSVQVALACVRKLWADWGIALAAWLPIQLGWVCLPNMPLPDAVAKDRYADQCANILVQWAPTSWHSLPSLPPHEACRQMQVHPLFAACVAFWAILVVRKLDGFQFRLVFTKDDLLLGLKLFVGFAPLALLVATATGFGDWSLAFTLHKTETNAPAWALYPLLPVGMYLGVALIEEALFRGVLQNLLGKALRSEVAAWVLASVAFGAVHLKYANPWSYAIFATAAGAVYGYAYRRTKRIMPGAITHALVNSLWLILFNPTWK